ncbi:MAG TPA: DUF6027 family protein [Acidimicrobiales bacterium]|nr:DUF6027 family protein [Acidimicrobiales bacterium]
MASEQAPVISLETWAGPWLDDDPHANFKAEVALWSKADPMETLEPFSEMVGIPVGAVCRSVLARWAAEGSAGRLELGPSMVERLWAVCEEAGSDSEKQLAAFDQLRQMLSWLRAPIE